MRGRKPTPNVIKFKTGNPGKRPLQYEPTPPALQDIPLPPSHLDEYGLSEWNRVSNGLYVMGVLYGVDVATLAAYCSSYSRWRHAEEEMQARVLKANNPLAALIDKTSNGNVIQNCLIGIANKAAADMVRYASELGMTPSARARLGVDPEKAKNSKFHGLIANGKRQ